MTSSVEIISPPSSDATVPAANSTLNVAVIYFSQMDDLIVETCDETIL
jgi:hypothetical protein